MFRDTFDRTASSSLGTGWLERKGDLAISGNKLQGTASGVNLAGWAQGAALNVAVVANVDLTGPATQVGLVARYTEPGSYYEGRLTRNLDGTVTAAIYRVTNGVATLRASAKWSGGVGQVRFEVSGSSLNLLYQGQTLSVTDTLFGGPGLVGVAMSTSVFVDNFTVTAL
ncbi:MAG: hypothetical protein U0736_15725 [Gemmataceae bacterium]